MGNLSQLDDATLDELLGDPASASVPAAYSGVARLLAAASGPATEDELAGEAEAVAAFVAVCANPTVGAPVSLARRRRISTRLAAAGLLGGLVLSGAAAAAATGSLPDSVQHAVSQALDNVGLSVPDSHTNTTGVDNGKGNGGVNQGGEGKHTGVTGHPNGQAGPPADATHTTGIDNGVGNNGTNLGGNGDHTGVSTPAGQSPDHTPTTHTPPTHPTHP